MSECRLTLMMREDAQGRDERWCSEHHNWSPDSSLPCYKARAEAAEAVIERVRDECTSDYAALVRFGDGSVRLMVNRDAVLRALAGADD